MRVTIITECASHEVTCQSTLRVTFTYARTRVVAAGGCPLSRASRRRCPLWLLGQAFVNTYEGDTDEDVLREAGVRAGTGSPRRACSAPGAGTWVPEALGFRARGAVRREERSVVAARRQRAGGPPLPGAATWEPLTGLARRWSADAAAARRAARGPAGGRARWRASTGAGGRRLLLTILVRPAGRDLGNGLKALRQRRLAAGVSTTVSHSRRGPLCATCPAARNRIKNPQPAHPSTRLPAPRAVIHQDLRGWFRHDRIAPTS